MRRPIRMVESLALVAVCLCAFVLPALAVECPLLAGSVAGEPGEGIAVAGGYAYVGRSEDSALGGGLDVYDVSDPTDPVLVGSLDASWFGYRIAVSGQYSFVAAGTGGLRVVDVSDPAMPVEVGNAFGGGHVFDVAVSGDHAFLIDHVMGLLVFDISDPAWPVMVGYLPLTDVHAIAVSGMYAYIAAGLEGMTVVDVSDPSQPFQVTSVPTQSPWPTTIDVEVLGDYAFLGSTWFFMSGAIYLSVVDVSNPVAAHLVGEYSTGNYLVGIAVSEQYVYISWWQWDGQGLTVVNVETPSLPTYAGGSEIGTKPVAVSDGFVYTPTTNWSPGGLTVFWDCALPVFGDGFESGDTSAWSATVP